MKKFYDYISNSEILNDHLDADEQEVEAEKIEPVKDKDSKKQQKKISAKDEAKAVRKGKIDLLKK